MAATYEQLMSKSRELYDSGDVEGAKRVAKIAISRRETNQKAEPTPNSTYEQTPFERENYGTMQAYEPSLYERFLTSARGVLPSGNAQDLRSIGAGVRSAVDTGLFNFGDEARAAANTAIDAVSGQPINYAENYADQKRRSDAAAAYNPDATNAGSVAGMFGGGAGIAKAGLSLASKAKTLPSMILGGAADGLLYGGLAGAGAGEGLDGRLKSARKSGLMGGAIGAGAPAVLSGSPALAALLKNKVKQTTGPLANQASARVANALPADASSRLADLGPDAMVMDVMGETGRAMARSAANNNSTAREMLEEASTTRMSGQTDRLGDVLLKAGGMDEVKTVQELMDGIHKANQPAIKKAYAKARSLGHDMDLEVFSDILGTTIGAKALNQGTKLAKDRAVLKGSNGDPSMLDILDETKKVLDGMSQPALGMRPDAKQQLAMETAKQLRERVDQSLPEYGGARALAQRSAKQQEAVKTGAEGGKPRVPADYARRSADVEFPNERSQGYVSQKIDALENRRTTPGVVDAMFGSKRQQQALAASLPEQGANDVKAQIARERVFNATDRALKGNSTTARQMAEMGLSGGAGGAAGYALGGDVESMGMGAAAGALARRGIPAIANKISAQKNENIAPLIADLLKGNTLPAPVAQVADTPALRQLIQALIAQRGAQAVNQ